VRQINSELRREIFDRYSSGASISDILGAYSDRELEAATHVATLADREHARRCRLVTWFVACCFVFMAFLSARSLIFDGNIASLIRLIIHSVISICLFRVRLWGFLGAIGWLFARVAINLRHVLGDQLTDADKNLYIADMAFYLVLACLMAHPD